MAEIDKLELQIKSDSTNASRGIDALIGTLDRLKGVTKGGLGLTAVANQIKKVSDASNTISPTTINNLKGLSDAIKTLSGIGNIKISASIANQITALNTALGRLNIGSGHTKIQALVMALQPLETLGKTNLKSTADALDKLPGAIAKIDTRKLYGEVQALTRTFKPLADEMQKIANGFSAFPSRIQSLIATNERLTQSNERTSKSYTDLYSKLRMVYSGIKTLISGVAKGLKLSLNYDESMNMFVVSMGKYAKEAYDYAEIVSDAMGIDPAEWMTNQSIFMTLATGFGVASDRAYKMSKNLTQLGYDLTSFAGEAENFDVSDAMLKLQSGLAGELEPLRRIGFDLSQARLQQEAYNLGIDKKIAKMTQAEKAELRYHAILTQVTSAHNDMANTLQAPANQLRVLKAQVTQAGRAIGDLFIPMLNAILPYAIAVVKVIRLVAESIAKLFGQELKTVDWSKGMRGMASGAEDIATGLDNATDSAKKLQQYTMGFDELNVIDPNKGSSGDSGAVGVGGSGFDFELPEYNFLEGLTESNTNSVFEKMKEHLPEICTLVAAIGAGFAAWGIHSSLIPTIETIKTLIGNGKFSMSFGVLGALAFMGDLATLKKFIDDYKNNGASFYNVAGMISTFAGLIGDALIILGNVKTGGALKVIEGVGQIVAAISDVSKNGINWDNVTTATTGISNLAIGIGAVTGNMQLAGAGLALQGVVLIVDEVKNIIAALKTGNWEDVSWANLAIGSIMAVGGVLVALGKFSGIKKSVDTTTVATELGEVGNTIGDVSTNTSTLTTKLKSFATNMAWGTLILAEVAVAAGIIVGSIWGLGLMLGQIGTAWQPVIENGGTVAIAMGLGVAILAVVGVATAALGTLGGAMAGQIGIGIAILAELGIATGLFLVEIWGIGKGLDEIGKAWQPVLDNGETIAKGIGIGTGLLVAIGVVTAALGVATVATAGALPLAIGLGTAILLELGGAFKAFCDNLIDVADKLSDDLHPELKDLNAILPDLNTEIENFKDFMIKFAEFVVEYSKSSAISGFASTITKIVGFFTKDPIKALSDDVNKQYNQASDLKTNLDLANPKLQDVIDGLGIYKARIDKIKEVTDTIDTTDMATDVFTNMVTISEKMADFGKEMKNYYDKIKDIKVNIMDNMVNCMNDVIDFAVRIKNEVDINKVNDFTKAIKDLTTAVKDLPTSKTLTITAIYKTSGTAPKQFATGGYPETGQMFIAREAGAELVGNIGRKTAVVNNEQIVASVSRGVAEANNEQNSLLREQNGLLRALLEKESGVYLDGKRLTNSVEKYQSQRGRAIVVGGAV